jgi:hypothetical protein
MPTLVPLELFSGYIIPYNKIPDYFLFLYNISFFAYALSLLEINQFSGAEFSECSPPAPGDTCPPAACFQTGEQLLASMNVYEDDVGRDVLALAVTFSLLSFLGYYAMRYVVGGWDGGCFGGFMGGALGGARDAAGWLCGWERKKGGEEEDEERAGKEGGGRMTYVF